MKEPFDPENLPLGASSASITVVKFNFIEAIKKFKATLPVDYVQNLWFGDLQNQCLILFKDVSSDHLASKDIWYRSKLYLQVKFLAGLYRSVCGTAAPENGWEKMLVQLSTWNNGYDDQPMSTYVFEEASNKPSEGELLAAIANACKRGRPAPPTITTMLPVASKAVDVPLIAIKDEVADAEDSEPVGKAASSTDGNEKRKNSKD